MAVANVTVEQRICGAEDHETLWYVTRGTRLFSVKCALLHQTHVIVYC